MKANKRIGIAVLIPGINMIGTGIILTLCFSAYFYYSYQNLVTDWKQQIDWKMRDISSRVSNESNELSAVFAQAIQAPNIHVVSLIHNKEVILARKSDSDQNLYENHLNNFSQIQSDFVQDSSKTIIKLDKFNGLLTAYFPTTSATAANRKVVVAEFDFRAKFNKLLINLASLIIVLLSAHATLSYMLFRLTRRTITEPLIEIANHAKLAPKRHFSEKARTYKSQELNTLALTFNQVQSQIKDTINNMEHNQTLYKVFTDALPQACAMVRMDGGIVSRFGPKDSLFFSNKQSDRIMDFVPNNYDLQLISLIRDCHGLSKTLHSELNIGSSSIPVHYDFSFTPVTVPVVGEPVTLVTAQNISERKKHEQTLSLLASVFESREAIAITDASHRIIRVNHEFCRITEYLEDELILGSMETFASEKHTESFWSKLWRKVSDEGSWAGELTIRKKNGATIPIRQTISVVRDEQDEIENFVLVFSDISEQKKAMALVRYHANFDTLTDLPNRRLFMHQLTRAMSQASRHKYFSALIFVDLDNFKQINDSYGHPVGDKVLIQIAKRIKQRIRNEDFLARLSGDEFVILLNQLANDDADSAAKAQQIATNILEEIRLPVVADQQNFLTSASLGITLFSETQNTAFDIMREADTAMYQAKLKGRNSTSFFSKDMQATVKQALNLANRISLAINEKEFRVHYQPQYDELSQLIGFEALVRWNPDSEESLSPADFIPVAEESGKIVELGDFILFEALRHLQIMIHQGLPESFKRLAINISPRQFMEHNFEQRITQALKQTQVPPSLVELEITEGSLMDNNDHALKLLERLKSMGFSIAIDDFGTGYSSLAYLKSLPIDKLKIDQYFVRDIVHNSNDAQIVETIISMAHAMGLRVIAEGVETKEQLDFLRKHNCFEYQGFYFSKPLSIEDILIRFFKKEKA